MVWYIFKLLGLHNILGLVIFVVVFLVPIFLVILWALRKFPHPDRQFFLKEILAAWVVIFFILMQVIFAAVKTVVRF